MVENGKRAMSKAMAEKVKRWAEENARCSQNLDISTENLDISTEKTPGFWTSQREAVEHGTS
jgi:hypothetical protein